MIMQDKMKINLLYIKDLRTPAANILKQDALSIGAELAVEKDTILCKGEKIDAVLIANDKQLKILAEKEKIQPFGLKNLAEELTVIVSKAKSITPQVMGIINATEDSFYQESRFQGKEAVSKIESVIEEGAKIIDLGAVSSRPGSKPIPESVELARLSPIIDMIYDQKLYEKAAFSLDSYRPYVLEYALDRGFSIVNDITGLASDEVARVASKYDARVVLMHMQGNPTDMQKEPQYENVILEIEAFFSQRIEKAKSFGIKDIILDVGIGFGKTVPHNLLLIKHLAHFQKFGYELLIGASRKSLIDKLSPSSVDERLAGTLALHLKSVEDGATILRCHDVKEHVQALKIYNAFEEVVL